MLNRMLTAALLTAASVQPLAAQQKVDIEEWTVPWERTRPRDPYVESETRVWFVGQGGDYLGLLNPKTGKFRKYDLEPGTGPHNLIVDAGGRVWYAGNRKAHIGRLDPGTGKITRYPMPEERARDPHTLVFDRNGNIWFTVQGGNFVGHLDTATAGVRLVPVPTERARPYGIKLDSKGWVWVAEFGSNKIAVINPETYELTEIELPGERTRPRRLVITSDDLVWYVDYAGGMLGRLDPETRKIQQWAMPDGPRSLPYGMAVDDRDRLWFVETGTRPNRFVGFDPRSNEFFSITDIPSGGGSVRHMFYHRPSQTIWFGTDVNTVGRAVVR